MKTLTRMFTLCCWSICLGSLLFSENTSEEKTRLEQERLEQKQIEINGKQVLIEQIPNKLEGIPVGTELDFINQAEKEAQIQAKLESMNSAVPSSVDTQRKDALIQAKINVATETSQVSQESLDAQMTLDKQAAHDAKMLQIEQLQNELNNSTEENNTDYKSNHTGCMHACGHDGHMAIILGVAEYFSECDNFKGTLNLNAFMYIYGNVSTG